MVSPGGRPGDRVAYAAVTPARTDDESRRGKGMHSQQNDTQASRDHFAFTHVITSAATSNTKNATRKYDAAPG